MTFNNDLDHDLAYMWSLPPHPTFERKIELIAVAIEKVALSPLHNYPTCQVFYFKCKICDIIWVSDIVMFAIRIHLIVFSRSILQFIVCKWRWHHQPSSTVTWNWTKSMTQSSHHLSISMYLHTSIVAFKYVLAYIVYLSPTTAGLTCRYSQHF